MKFKPADNYPGQAIAMFSENENIVTQLRELYPETELLISEKPVHEDGTEMQSFRMAKTVIATGQEDMTTLQVPDDMLKEIELEIPKCSKVYLYQLVSSGVIRNSENLDEAFCTYLFRGKFIPKEETNEQ